MKYEDHVFRVIVIFEDFVFVLVFKDLVFDAIRIFDNLREGIGGGYWKTSAANTFHIKKQWNH